MNDPLPFEHIESGAMPPVVDRAPWQAELDELLVREKAHTRAGDALAAARRRLPMVQVPTNAAVDGPNGRVPLIDVFEGRRMLIAYYMWHQGQPWPGQCEGNVSAPHRCSGPSTCTHATSPSPSSARAATRRVTPTPTSSATSPRGTPPSTPSNSSPDATSASTPATCATAMTRLRDLLDNRTRLRDPTLELRPHGPQRRRPPRTMGRQPTRLATHPRRPTPIAHPRTTNRTVGGPRHATPVDTGHDLG